MPPIEDRQQYVGRRFLRVVVSETRFEEVEFSDCVFDRCTFSRCTFYRCSFVECRFNVCDLAGVQVPNSRFVNVQVTGSKLIGVDWTQAGESTVSKLPISVDYDDCVLSYSSFFGMKLAGRSLVRCTAHELDLREADLTDAVLTGTDFAGALFRRTNLTRADLSGASNYSIDPTVNTITKARFSLPEAVSLLRGFDVVIE